MVMSKPRGLNEKVELDQAAGPCASSLSVCYQTVAASTVLS